jgi:hypothetical protein
VKVGDGRVGQVVSVEELGLGDTTVAALAVPPTSTVRVQVGTTSTLDGDLGALDLQEGSVPFTVTPGSLTLEDDLYRCQYADRTSED